MRENFAELGFDSTYILNIMGTMALYFVCYLLLMPLQWMIAKCKDCSPRIFTLNWRLTHYLYYSSLIMVLFEGCLVIAIGVQIGLYNLNFDTFGSRFQACSAIFFAVFLVAAPCMLIRKAVKNFKNLKDRQV